MGAVASSRWAVVTLLLGAGFAAYRNLEFLAEEDRAPPAASVQTSPWSTPAPSENLPSGPTARPRAEPARPGRDPFALPRRPAEPRDVPEPAPSPESAPRSGVPEAPPPAQHPPRPDLRVEMICRVGETWTAIVNGRPCQPGDAIEGVRVAAIGRGEVVFDGPGGPFSLRTGDRTLAGAVLRREDGAAAAGRNR